MGLWTYISLSLSYIYVKQISETLSTLCPLLVANCSQPKMCHLTCRSLPFLSLLSPLSPRPALSHFGDGMYSLACMLSLLHAHSLSPLFSVMHGLPPLFLSHMPFPPPQPLLHTIAIGGGQLLWPSSSLSLLPSVTS